MKKTKKYSITLIEIMIVILLIGLISGALAYNMSGSLDEGRVFKTEQNKSRLYDILVMESAKGAFSLEQVAKEWESVVKSSPLASPDLILDGWKEKFNVSFRNDDIVISSQKLQNYRRRHAKK